MPHSMTAFASRTGALPGVSWQWDLRGVNARGLDIRMRLPDGLDGLEAIARAALTKALSRGSVSLGLRSVYDDTAQPLILDAAQLDRVLGALDQVQERAFAMGVTLGQPTAADVLNTRGVIIAGRADDTGPALLAALSADLADLVADFVAMRASEGQALSAIVTDQIEQISTLVDAAATAAIARRADVQTNLTTALRRVMADVAEIDEARVAQELALLAVKADVTEEINRLQAHVAAARNLLAQDGPIGRKLDFLSQEFNREANTLCAKAGSTALTAIGLDLKAVIDQMREQIQNVE